jgi:hypothetical protein
MIRSLVNYGLALALSKRGASAQSRCPAVARRRALPPFTLLLTALALAAACNAARPDPVATSQTDTRRPPAPEQKRCCYGCTA